MASKTALDLDPSQWRQYHPFAEKEKRISQSILTVEAQETAKNVAQELVNRFQAKKVVLFGSLARGDFNRWSDIDLAVWGIAPSRFYHAVSFASGYSRIWPVNLVDGEDCSDSLLKIIMDEGVEL